MKSLIVVPLAVVGTGLLILILKFGTVTPCGILRAEIRQEAARKGGLGVLLAALPDSIIDGLLVAQYGPMSPGRCIELALSGAPVQPPPAPRANPLQEAQRQARIRAQQLANLRSLTERMLVFATKADAALPKFLPAERRYQYITERMRAALSREQSIYGDGQSSVVRGQISVAIGQAAIQAGQLHINVQVAYRDFDFNAGQLTRESTGASQGCRGAHAVTEADPPPVGYEAWNSACLRFFGAAKIFQQRLSKLRTAFAQIEEVWNAERRKQDEIIQASNLAIQ